MVAKITFRIKGYEGVVVVNTPKQLDEEALIHKAIVLIEERLGRSADIYDLEISEYVYQGMTLTKSGRDSTVWVALAKALPLVVSVLAFLTEYYFIFYLGIFLYIVLNMFNFRKI